MSGKPVLSDTRYDDCLGMACVFPTEYSARDGVFFFSVFGHYGTERRFLGETSNRYYDGVLAWRACYRRSIRRGTAVLYSVFGNYCTESRLLGEIPSGVTGRCLPFASRWLHKIPFAPLTLLGFTIDTA